MEGLAVANAAWMSSAGRKRPKVPGGFGIDAAKANFDCGGLAPVPWTLSSTRLAVGTGWGWLWKGKTRKNVLFFARVVRVVSGRWS